MNLRATKSEVNLRDSISSLEQNTGVAGHDMLRAESPQQQFDMIGAGRRNLIINGDFQVNQQGDISDTPVDGIGFDNRFPIDRWQLDANDVPNLKLSVEYDSKLKSKYLKLHNDGPQTIPSSAMQIYQHIERSHALRNKTLTFSAWVKSNTRFKLQLFDGVNFSDSPDVTSIHSGNNSWELLVGRFIIPDAYQVDQRHIQARITRYVNSSWQVLADEYVCITQLQLEFGNVRTPFEQRTYSHELMLCQRYFQRIDSWNVTPMWAYTHGHASTLMTPKTTMRRCPWFANNTSGESSADKHRTGLHGVHAAYHIGESITARIYLWNSETNTMNLVQGSTDKGTMNAGSDFSINFDEESLGEFRYDVARASGHPDDVNFVKGGTLGGYSHGQGSGIQGYDQIVNPAYITLDAEIFHYNNT